MNRPRKAGKTEGRRGELKSGIRAGVRSACVLAVLITCAATQDADAAIPSTLWTRCDGPPPTLPVADLLCSRPRGLMADSGTGDIIAVDSGNHRIVRLSVWGEFLQASGWGVVDSGPDNQPSNEIQKLSVNASAGSFRLRYIDLGSVVSGPIAFDASAAAVEAALEAASPFGVGAAVSGSPGEWTIEYRGDQADSDIALPQVFESSLTGGAATARLETLQHGANYEVCVPAHGDVCSAGQAGSSAGQLDAPQGIAGDTVGNVYVADFSNSRLQKFNSDGQFLLTWGGDVVATGPDDSTNNEQQQLVVTATGGTFKLKFARPYGGPELPVAVPPPAETEPLPFDATASEVEAALEALPTISGFGGEVSVSGGPGDPTGSSPYSISFEGDLGGDDLPQLQIDRGGLEPAPSGPEPVTTLNQGGGPEVCRASAGDTCKDGVKGTDGGEFGAWPVGNFVAVGPDATIYVGDEKRIQRFDADGNYLGELTLPEAGTPPGPGTVGSLAVDPVSGDLYFSFSSQATSNQKDKQPNVYRLDETTGAVLDILPVERPRAVAVDSSGNLYAFDQGIGPNVAGNHVSRLLAFDPSGNQIEELSDGDEFDSLAGLATGDACGIDGQDVYVSHLSPSFVRAYGPQPDPLVCPPPAVPPEIEAQFSSAVDTETATLRAKINPHFWSGVLGTTTYLVQYGTAACIDGGGWEASCVSEQPTAPGSTLGGGIVDVAVTTGDIFLDNLTPNTTYRYRFIAQGSGAPGVSIVGAGGKEGEEGTAASFATLPPSSPARENCPNRVFRSGASARLPDCRAFELVSPLEKEGGDITARGAELDQSASDRDWLTYTSFRAFGGAESSQSLSQYIARRDPVAGWQNEAISPPREGPSFWGGHPTLHIFEGVNLQLHYKFFSEDLCSGWNLENTEPQLAEGAIAGYANLYRRDNCAATPGFEALSTVEPPDLVPQAYGPGILGFSADGTHSVFESSGKLTDETPACVVEEKDCPRHLYMADGGDLSLVSVLPNGMPSQAPNNPLGTAYGGSLQGRETDSTYHAVSGDGTRVYWSQGTDGGPLFVRLNPTEGQSTLITGTGNLSKESATVKGLITAEGKGTLSAGSATVTGLETTLGQFLSGQPISGTGIPAGTTIVEVSGTALTLSAQATSSGTVTIKSAGPAPFAVGRHVSGEGIPAETTIVAVAPGELTLSKPASAGKLKTTLTAGCGEPQKACTVAVSGQAANFWAAAPDGGIALYSVGPFTNAELRVFDLATQTSQTIANGVLGVMGASADLSRIYFASRETLSGEEENALGQKAQAGEPNLYLYEAGGGFTFVARLSELDVSQSEIDNAFAPLHHEPSKRTSRVSPDGAKATFTSTASLTGYDNVDAVSGEADAEVFLYDQGTKELVCISCNPSGARPLGADLGLESEPRWMAATVPPWVSPSHAPRVLSEDGSRLFFESTDGLVLADTNGRRDVYEWEGAASAAQCGPAGLGAELYVAAAGGCISLLSGGQSGGDAEFVDASPDGSDVFVRTAASLLAHDPDLIDIYDAREGGGFPPPLVEAPSCEGEACQNPPPPPELQTPASSSTSGSGNLAGEPSAPHCRKGKVRRGGRCVPRRHKRHVRKRAGAKQRAAR